MRWLDSITDLTDMSLGELQELVMYKGGLACCDSWGRKESDTIEHLNCTEYAFYEKLFFFVCTYTCIWSLLVAQRVKEFAFNAGDPCWIPGS